MAVRFASANKRRTTQSWFLVTALHIAVAIGIGFILTRQWGGDPWVTAAFVYGGFLALSLIWWLSTQLVGWLVWRVLWRSAAVNDLVASFQNLKLPKPRSSYAVPSDYFLDIADNEEIAYDIRFGAVAHYMRLSTFAPEQGFIVMARTSGLYEKAIAAYRATFRD